MSKFLQKRYFRQILNELYEDQTYASKMACKLYGIIAIFLNINVAHRFLQTHSWRELYDPVLGNLFLLGSYILLISLPFLARYFLLRNWFICQRELIAHYASRARIPPPHILLPGTFSVLAASLTIAFHRTLRQTTTHRPPHLNLRRKAPFLLFQRANLLLAP